MKTYTVKHIENGSESVELSYKDAKETASEFIYDMGGTIEIWKNNRYGSPVELCRTETALWVNYHLSAN